MGRNQLSLKACMLSLQPPIRVTARVTVYFIFMVTVMVLVTVLRCDYGYGYGYGPWLRPMVMLMLLVLVMVLTRESSIVISSSFVRFPPFCSILQLPVMPLIRV